MTQNQQQDELNKIEQAIAAQEALRGIVPDAQIEETLTQLRQKRQELQGQSRHQASVPGSGAVAQGEGAKAVGERGVLVEGNVGGSINTGSGQIVQYFYTNAAGEPTPLPPHLAKLLKEMKAVFSKSELYALCFELGIDADDLPGDTRTELAQSLLLTCHQQKRLPQLLALCRSQRPHADWRMESP